MKTVQFQGINYEVPDWARYIAQDGHATITVHEAEPLRAGSSWLGVRGRWDVIGGCGAPMVVEAIT